MTAYRCLVLTEEGRTDRRVVDASGSAAAAARLIAEGVTPLDIRSGRVGFAERLNQPIRLGGPLRVAEQALILGQLATLVGAGLPIDRSLDLIAEQASRAATRRLLAEAVKDLRSGTSLAGALDGLGSFPSYVVGVLRAAERGGKLGEALRSLAERVEAAASARRQLVTALSYPAAVLLATVAALMLVLTEVVPQFAPIFRGEEARLPWLTRIVLALSALVGSHSLLLLLLLLGGALAVLLLWRSPPRRLAEPDVRRLIPGLALRDHYLAGQLIGILGTLVRNGVVVIEALPLARGAIASVTWRSALDIVERQVREGARLSSALAGMKLVPVTAIRLVEVGERSGALADACGQASAVIAEAAKARLDRIIALANPIAIILLGGLVGSLVAGVMLGIFALGDLAG